MNSRSPNRPYVIVLTRFPGGEPHTIRLKALQVVRPDRDPLYPWAATTASPTERMVLRGSGTGMAERRERV